MCLSAVSICLLFVLPWVCVCMPSVVRGQLLCYWGSNHLNFFLTQCQTGYPASPRSFPISASLVLGLTSTCNSACGFWRLNANPHVCTTLHQPSYPLALAEILISSSNILVTAPLSIFYFQNKPNTKKSMGIFQWENFQNHQRLKLPSHNWKSPPKRREINLSSSWACQLKHRLPLMQNCHKAIPSELNPIIRSSPSLPLVLGVFIIGLLEPRHSFCQGKFSFEATILSKQRTGVDSGSSKDGSELC